MLVVSVTLARAGSHSWRGVEIDTGLATNRAQRLVNIHCPQAGTHSLPIPMHSFAANMDIGILLYALEIIGISFAALVGFYVVFLGLGAIPFVQRQ